MNTVRSFWFGWGSLCVAGGGAFYFAKREINADRRAKLEAARNKKQAQALQSAEYARLESTPASTTAGSAGQQEVGQDAAATDPDRMKERSKYESPVPYTSRKGDRFS
ncbi:hypothetical protein E4U41_003327 [Claviceps citrina]|nr:hypothetical protein E4U41_003327 [Claviceps citrina]